MSEPDRPFKPTDIPGCTYWEEGGVVRFMAATKPGERLRSLRYGGPVVMHEAFASDRALRPEEIDAITRHLTAKYQRS